MFAGILLRDWKKAFSLAHPSVSACASVSIGSHLEVCDRSTTEAEEATEEKGTDPFLPSPLPSSFRLCFRLCFHGSH